jgi:hypothetical protein
MRGHWKRLEQIAAAASDRAAAMEEEGDVATEPGGEIVEPGVAHVQQPELVPTEERGRGIARRPAETGGGGDTLAEVHPRAAGIVRLITQETKRAQGEVVLAGEGIVATAQLEIVGRREGESIVEVDGHEDSGDLVKPVVAAAHHLETEIELGRGVDDHPSHNQSGAVTRRRCHAE